jgi:hypothetical protein
MIDGKRRRGRRSALEEQENRGQIESVVSIITQKTILVIGGARNNLLIIYRRRMSM